MTMERSDDKADAASTRRAAIKLGGGGLLAALALARFGGRSRVVAQEASPVAGEGLEGRYVVIRMRKLKADRSADELAELIRTGFLPLVTAIPGFVSYFAVVDAETRDQFSVNIFADKAGADESTRVAGEWGPQGANDYVEGEPTLVEGGIDIAAGAST